MIKKIHPVLAYFLVGKGIITLVRLLFHLQLKDLENYVSENYGLKDSNVKKSRRRSCRLR
jgi:hypothetical protein